MPTWSVHVPCWALHMPIWALHVPIWALHVPIWALHVPIWSAHVPTWAAPVPARSPTTTRRPLNRGPPRARPRPIGSISDGGGRPIGGERVGVRAVAEEHPPVQIVVIAGTESARHRIAGLVAPALADAVIAPCRRLTDLDP